MVAATTANGSGPTAPIIFYDLAPSPGICPFAQRSKIVLKEKQLPYDEKLIDKANKPQGFLDLFRSVTSDPKGRGTVPTIEDGNIKLTESHVVSEYLDTAYPHSGTKLFPTDPVELAQVKLFVEIATSQVQANISKQLTTTDAEAISAARAAYSHGLTVLDAFLRDHGGKGGDFLLGSHFTYAEASFLPFLYRSFQTLNHFRGFDVPAFIAENKLDHLEKWYKAGFARPSVKETLPSDQLIVERSAKNGYVVLK